MGGAALDDCSKETSEYFKGRCCYDNVKASVEGKCAASCGKLEYYFSPAIPHPGPINGGPPFRVFCVCEDTEILVEDLRPRRPILFSGPWDACMNPLDKPNGARIGVEAAELEQQVD